MELLVLKQSTQDQKTEDIKNKDKVFFLITGLFYKN